MTARTPEAHPEGLVAPARSIDVHTGPGRQTLRVSVLRTPAGDPEAAILAPGFGEGEDFIRPHWAGEPLRIEADAIGALLEALHDLAGAPPLPWEQKADARIPGKDNASLCRCELPRTSRAQDSPLGEPTPPPHPSPGTTP